MDVLLLEEQGQLHGVLQGAPGVGGHEVGHQELLLPQLLGDAVKFLRKSLVNVDVGLAHGVQNVAGAVLRGHLQLTGDVVLDQLLEKGVVGVLHHIVVPDSRPDEHPLDPRQLPDLPQQLQIVPLVGVQGRTGGGGQALSSHAEALFLLLFAGGMPEVGRGPAHIVDVALEPGQRGQELCLGQHRFLAADGDLPPLVEGDGAEVAVAEAPPVVGDGELHLRQAGNAALRVVHGVPAPGVGQGVDVVQLLGGQNPHGRVLDQHFLLLAL